MLTKKVCDRTCCSIVSNVFELSACLFCKTCCCKVPDRAVTGVTHGNLVLFCVVDEVFDRVETVIFCVYCDRCTCAVYHHDRFEHGICKTSVCSHSLKSCKLYCDHGNGCAISLSVCASEHTGCSAAAGTVLYGDVFEGTLRCVC